MKIWVMRHGEAGFNAITDSQRTLTEKGRQMAFGQGQWLEKRLQHQQLQLDKVIVSPYQRTQQTAEQLLLGMQAVNATPQFANVREDWVGITPSGKVENVLNYLTFLATEGCQTVLIISHLPLVFDLVQGLTQYQQNVHFYPAVIAEIEWQKGKGTLITTASP